MLCATGLDNSGCLKTKRKHVEPFRHASISPESPRTGIHQLLPIRSGGKGETSTHERNLKSAGEALEEFGTTVSTAEALATGGRVEATFGGVGFRTGILGRAAAGEPRPGSGLQPAPAAEVRPLRCSFLRWNSI